MTNHADLEGIPASWIDAGLKICTDLLGGKINGDKINDILCPACSKPRAYTHVKDPLTIICNRKNNCRNTSLLKEFPHHFEKNKSYIPPKIEEKPLIIATGKTLEQIEHEVFSVHRETNIYPEIQGKASPCPPVPEEFKPLVNEINRHMNCPPSYHSVLLHSTLLNCVGDDQTIQLKNRYKIKPFASSLIIGPPGINKTPVARIWKEPLYDLDSEIIGNEEPSDLVKYDYEEAVKVLKACLKYNRGKNPTPPAGVNKEIWKDEGARGQFITSLSIEVEELKQKLFKPPGFIVQEINAASVLDQLKKSPRPLLADYDELSQLMELLEGPYSHGLRGYFLRFNSGTEVIKKYTISDGLTRMEGAGLSVMANTQPDIIKRYFSSKNDNLKDGLLERFQICAFDEFTISREMTPEDYDDKLIDSFYEKMKKFPKTIRDQKTSQPITHVKLHSDGAKENFWKMDYEFQKMKDKEKHPYIRGCLSKIPVLLGKIAYLSMQIENIFHDKNLTYIHQRHLAYGYKYCEWQIEQYKKIAPLIE